MIIQELTIENYLCYYGIKKFVFSDGLNIILGENGEGKTKFYESIDWLFKGDVLNLDQLVSAKKLDEIAIGESFRVRVSITVKQHSETKILTRQFSVKKTGEIECEASKLMLEGIEESTNGERNQVDGLTILEQFFPSTIRKYSMFKGEAALDIFENTDTLITLIKAFSEAKHYDKYTIKGDYLKLEAEKAVDSASRSATRNREEYNKLENDIKHLETEKNNAKSFLNITQYNIVKLKGCLEDAANYVTNASDLDLVNKRIGDIKNRIDTLQRHIHEGFTTSLFDDQWILVNYENLHKQFAKKIYTLSNKRRELQSQFDTEKGIKIGEKQAHLKLINNAIPLPTTVPSKAIMEEMLADELCKVCNRPAVKGSEPYDFMRKRLEEYVTSQLPIEEESGPEKLFINDYTTKLVNLAGSQEESLGTVRGIKLGIKELFEFNDKLRSDIQKLDAALDREINERDRILGNSTLGETKLKDVLINYNAWQKDLLDSEKEEQVYLKKIDELTARLKEKKSAKDNIDVQTANNFLIKTRAILRDVSKIFYDTRENKFDEFVTRLQKLSNNYFAKINAGAFTGNVVFIRKKVNQKQFVVIELHEQDRILYKPNQSLLTSMHISVLFAISQLASEENEESYPMIFDAPTSSFGETKTGAFLNIISDIDSQIILLSKDYIAEDSTSKNLSIKPDFAKIKKNKAFWVRLERPFDSQVLKTLNTEIITL